MYLEYLHAHTPTHTIFLSKRNNTHVIHESYHFRANHPRTSVASSTKQWIPQNFQIEHQMISTGFCGIIFSQNFILKRLRDLWWLKAQCGRRADHFYGTARISKKLAAGTEKTSGQCCIEFPSTLKQQ